MDSLVNYLYDRIIDNKVVLNLNNQHMLFNINFSDSGDSINSITVDDYIYELSCIKKIPGFMYTKEYIHNSLHFYNCNNGEEESIVLYLDKSLDALEVTVTSCDGCESFYWIK